MMSENDSKPGKLAGKVAIITGAAGGIGRAAATLFAEEGATVIATDIKDTEAGSSEKELPNIYFRLHDVTSAEGWAEIADWSTEQFGVVDILVNNAAIQYEMPLEETSVEAYEKVCRVNQLGPFLGMRAVVPIMKRAGGGSIVNMSSTAGLGGLPGMTAYVASKYAVRGMTKVAALELARHHIRVNSVHPGLTDTPMTQRFSIEKQQARARATLFGRAANPSEIANLILFLASDAASFCSGGEYVCDGASTATPRL